MKLKIWVTLSFIVLGIAACTPEDEKPGTGNFLNGVFITCEGNFGRGTGTISFYDRETRVVVNDLYGKANGGAALGDVLQDFKIYNDTAYMVVNGKNKIVLADAKTFKFLDSITVLRNPRYIYRLNTFTAYVSEWGADGLTGSLKEVDLKSKSVTKTIRTGTGADRLFVIGSRIYVLNNNGFGKDSTLAYYTVGDTTLAGKITVGVSPNSIVQDANSDLWVLCGDAWGVAKTGKLVKLRNSATSVISSFNLPANVQHLVADNSRTTLYFGANNGEIWKKDLQNFGNNPPTLFMSKAETGIQNLYGMGFDPKSGYIYCADALNNTQNGKVIIIDPNTKKVVDSPTVGIIPNGFLFR